jgi:hypothetical protein
MIDAKHHHIRGPLPTAGANHAGRLIEKLYEGTSA